MSEENKDIQKLEIRKDIPTYASTSNKCVDTGILLELGSIGAGHAATSLSDVLQEKVVLDVPKIHTLPPHLLPRFYDQHETPTTAIYMQLAGESGCDILLMLESTEAKKIAATMTMVPSIEELDPSMEASAIQELANILIGSFISAISDFTGANLLLTPPERILDSFDAILDNVLVKQALVSDEALVFDTCLRRTSENIKSVLIVFPSPELQAMLIQKSKELLGEDHAKSNATESGCAEKDSVEILAATLPEEEARIEGT